MKNNHKQQKCSYGEVYLLNIGLTTSALADKTLSLFPFFLFSAFFQLLYFAKKHL
ncbi:hypothetical protein Runsl_1181 [Runella slithyformis DSM 19594]|uniref:Uncharacterized protein n=1 Tax=Runella slithyformis (strain ATCC 29530 / DSM 19594 / LMG 11500 / NCIMB 11436 / LSU 4) TaxID=761193 RepID=A0A7U3ZI42_RUNSL|nr:hypothetical protein Runsl_1181 [Runella slithyformis DSM 19594]